MEGASIEKAVETVVLSDKELLQNAQSELEAERSKTAALQKQLEEQQVTLRRQVSVLRAGLKAQLETVQGKLQKLQEGQKEELDVSEKQIQELQAVITARDEQIKKLRADQESRLAEHAKQLEDTQAEASALRGQAEGLQVEIKACRSELESKATSERDLHTQLDALNEQLQKLSAEREEERKAAAESNSSQAAQMEKQLGDAREEVEQLRSQNGTLQAELTASKEQLTANNSGDKNAEQEKDLAEAKQTASLLRGQNAVLRVQLQSFREKFEKLVGTMQNLSGQIKKAKEENAELAALAGQAERFEVERAEALRVNEILEGEIDKQLAEIKTCKEQLAQRALSEHGLQMQLASLKEEMERLKAEQQGELERLKAAQQEQLVQHANGEHGLQQQLGSVKDELERVKAEQQGELERLKAAQQEQLAQHANGEQGLHQQLSSVKEELERVKAEQQGELERLKAAQQEEQLKAQQEAASLNEQLQRLQAERQEERLAASNSAELASYPEERQQHLAQLDQHLAEARKESESLREEVGALQAEVKDGKASLERQVLSEQTLHAQITSLNEQIEQHRAERQLRESNSVSELGEQQQRTQELEKKLAEARDHADSCRAEVEDLQAEVRRRDDELRRRELLEEDLRGQLGSARQQVGNLEAEQHSNCSILSSELQESKRRETELEKKYEDSLIEANRLRDQVGEANCKLAEEKRHGEKLDGDLKKALQDFEALEHENRIRQAEERLANYANGASSRSESSMSKTHGGHNKVGLTKPRFTGFSGSFEQTALSSMDHGGASRHWNILSPRGAHDTFPETPRMRLMPSPPVDVKLPPRYVRSFRRNEATSRLAKGWLDNSTPKGLMEDRREGASVILPGIL